MLASLAAYTSDAAGLEKCLRFLQAICTIALGLLHPFHSHVEGLRRAKGHFALGRRYFRLLKWYPCSVAARKCIEGNNHQSLSGKGKPSARETSSMSIPTLLDTTKWTLLALYFFLEMWTFTNAMGVTTFTWGTRVQLEANKCWFYAICASIALSLYSLLFPAAISNIAPSKATDSAASALTPESTTTTTIVRGKPPIGEGSRTSPPSSQSNRASHWSLMTGLLTDACDLLIPGSAIGWTPASGLVVGTSMAISTLLSGRVIWVKVQQERSS
ncbi:unnamed protein product [Zymoseptoria tritici ST99CH_1A5]|uniref:Uncharacterized protein n=2 Tax=Zymoseptoria tritici TaxID=1047171 RepID=A0A2H1GY29_ZYMTR|nr:unnamed protein product [Zymoseptoria tritici ST99CH_1E4]SMR61460.1 unnamed protein product [Zymoseptoria tritici ST99CH_3D1]SMY27676.1 unnamed protein product [Zymoseptoria tritici ST99CH_1A5]